MRRTALRRVGRRSKAGKFGNIPKVYGDREYHSTMEAQYARNLDLRKHALVDRVKEWKAQVPVKLEVNGHLVTTYVCDFVVEYVDGRIEWVEIKGFETETWKIKEKLFRALFPERMLLVVKRTPRPW